MSRTYKTTGIVLKRIPFKEADHLVTILSPEFGLIRAVVPGARKHTSRLSGRSELFVINDLLILKGRSLDRIIQADTLNSYSRLSKDLGKLAAGQYLAEFVLSIASDKQPQRELYELINEHLHRLEKISSSHSLHSHLAQGVFHFLIIAGVMPQVHTCCLTGETLSVDFNNPHWRVGFSFEEGGLIKLTNPEFSLSTQQESPRIPQYLINWQLNAVELSLLQQLVHFDLPQPTKILPPDYLNDSLPTMWVRIEHLLRNYAQYHLGATFRSADLIDSLSSLEF
ncbi:DNA repair protein RecO [Cyanobacterium sp. uoEpiScrs1]|uniref:DNA repair protein RecO n=1 Tax=Cyanobacterium sp. uoEpiScrs1 TaxID=2976343 RepID=UPI00226993C4|nr:DNA repair protein RecO [Cyanobacterium sp. uoEpiScrs1]